MNESLAGKIAVITGGGAGLGRHIAAQFVAAGANVALFGRTGAKVEAAAAALGNAAHPVAVDVSKSDQVREAFLEVDRRFGGVDILVNNAAVYKPFAIEDATDAQVHEAYDNNIVGPIFCIREAIPRMRKRGGGDIVNISSESVVDPFPCLVAYASTKGALETLSLGLRGELKADRIRVTTIRSGYMAGDNSGAAAWPVELLHRFVAAAQAAGRPVTAEQGMQPLSVARAVVHAVTAPRDASVGLYDVRPTGAGAAG